MTANNPSEKEMATEKKEERIKAAERREGKTHSYSTSGAIGQPSGAHQMSALPGHGSGQPTGASVVEGVVPSHPIGKATGTHVGATGGSYT
ncbi:hypothetical protein R3W88_033803 [Solanum pinnatisectum]|uniref:Uncharacterized protein n=1 Tax=Solanum pinnatisectum TaxID=50273 RepID=A0AAV9K101_9SOLN|nr:hypothetical protein R3W88_033803 [Solanum pinnatisectum]